MLEGILVSFVILVLCLIFQQLHVHTPGLDSSNNNILGLEDLNTKI